MKNISTFFIIISFSIDIIHKFPSLFTNPNTSNQFIYSLIIPLFNLLLLLHLKHKFHIYLLFFIISAYSLYTSILSKKKYIQSLPAEQSNQLFLMIFLFNTNIITNIKQLFHLFLKLFSEFSDIIINVFKFICNLISIILYLATLTSSLNITNLNKKHHY